MVFRKDRLCDLSDDVVQMDVPPAAHRPVADAGMEIPLAHQPDEPVADSVLNLNEMALLKDIGTYFEEIYRGVVSLLKGMRVTGGYFLRPGAVVTQQYPENRAELKMFDNFKGELILTHDENNQHSCNACNSCARKCPNGSIEIVSTRVQGEDGRSKRVLVTHTYNLGMCTFCGLCVQACEQHALEFGQEFEHAVFDKSNLTKVLNKPGSTSKATEE